MFQIDGKQFLAKSCLLFLVAYDTEHFFGEVSEQLNLRDAKVWKFEKRWVKEEKRTLIQSKDFLLNFYPIFDDNISFQTSSVLSPKLSTQLSKHNPEIFWALCFQTIFGRACTFLWWQFSWRTFWIIYITYTTSLGFVFLGRLNGFCSNCFCDFHWTNS